MPEPINLLHGPVVGFYKRRFVRGGPWVPAKIWWDRGDIDPESGDQMSDDVLRCVVDGRYCDIDDQWNWIGGNPITEAEYNFMVADAAHARVHRPDDAKATPYEPIDLGMMKPVF